MKFCFPALLFLMATVTSCTAIVDVATKESIQTDPNTRSFGTYLDDKRLQTIAAVNIRKADPELKEADINVDSYNRVILLTGQVPSAELRNLAAKTASAVPHVRQVHNELQIKGKAALLSRSNDAWLSLKIKSILIADKNINEIKIKTVIEDGVVYLMGLVTQEEAYRVANLLSNIGGVKEVVRVFEYTTQGRN